MKTKTIVIIISIIFTLVFAGSAFAQISDLYDLSWNVLGAGGGKQQSQNYLLIDSAGQAFVGVSISQNYDVSSGFLPSGLNGSSLLEQIYLPMVLKSQ